jgi:CspA family cold shock protein
MEQPLEVAFHGLPASDALHAHIDQQAQKLERFGKAVTSVRVSLERAQRHGGSDVDEVHIDIQLRGKHLFAKETTEHRHRGEDNGVYSAISKAMDHAVRQIDSDLAKRVDKPLQAAHEGVSHGRVVRLDGERRFGFVERAEGPDLFFHEAVLKDTGFEALREGDTVRFGVAEAEGAYGPQARFVERVAPGSRPGE